MPSKFALIGHHLSLDLLYKNRPELRGKPLSEIKNILMGLPPEKATDLNGVKSKNGKEIQGLGIVVNLLPEQFFELEPAFVLSKIIGGIELAKEHGANIMVLGAATAIVGNQGKYVSGKVKDVAITTGNTYTAASVIEAIKESSKLIRIDLAKATVVVVGATGSIGTACSHILSDLSTKVVLVARNRKRLETLAKELAKKDRAKIEVAGEGELKSIVKQADICITVTSAPFALVDANDFKPGALVCDVAAPRNVSLESGQLRKDVLVIDGGLITPPGNLARSAFDIGLPEGGAPACLCEGMILALEDRVENYTLGPGIAIEKLREIYDLGKKHGFKLSSFRSFGKLLSKEYINQLVGIRK